MSERKVLTKYYPPEFDPSKITRAPRHQRGVPKLMTVRLMAPYSMKCTSCGEYIYKGRKFNARKETTDEKYLNLPIYRFYIRCTRCSSEITFKTDPKNMDYTCERGAKRNFESWRDPENPDLAETDEQRLDRLEREEMEAAEEAEKNAMEELEQKMEESKREMKVADALDEIRMRNARIERGERGGKEDIALAQVRDTIADQCARQEQEDEEAVRRAFERENVEKARREELRTVNGLNPIKEEEETSSTTTHSFERGKKARKAFIPGLVKRSEASSASQAQPAQKQLQPRSVGLGLGAYGSDDDD